jgi:hypothetical protein
MRRAEWQEAAERPDAAHEAPCAHAEVVRARALPSPVRAAPSGPQPSLPLRLQADADEGAFFTDGPFIETKEFMPG